jgi:hypothetical protein
METCGYEFYFVLETYSVTREIIKMQYRRDVGFIFCQASSPCSPFELFSPRLPAILNFPPLALGLDAGSRVRPSVSRSNSCAVFFLKISSVYLWWLMMIKSVELD